MIQLESHGDGGRFKGRLEVASITFSMVPLITRGSIDENIDKFNIQ
jgi:hypothetical protein